MHCKPVTFDQISQHHNALRKIELELQRARAVKYSPSARYRYIKYAHGSREVRYPDWSGKNGLPIYDDDASADRYFQFMVAKAVTRMTKLFGYVPEGLVINDSYTDVNVLLVAPEQRGDLPYVADWRGYGNHGELAPPPGALWRGTRIW